MLKLNGKAEVKQITLRTKVRDDKIGKYVTVRMRFVAVPIEMARTFVTQLPLFFGVETESQFPEVDFLPVTKTLEDVLSVVNGVKLRGNVSGVKIYPRGGRTVEIDLKIHAPIEKGLDKLHDVLKETTAVDMQESPPEAEQRSEAA